MKPRLPTLEAPDPLVGGSGAGKSTLMKAMAGYLEPSRGQVTVNGDDFYEHLDAYRALLGYVPQILFSGVLFPLGSGYTTTRIFSLFTVSRWAMDAYGTSINLGRLPPPSRVVPAEIAFTRDNLALRWAILGGYALLCLIAACVLLARRDRER